MNCSNCGNHLNPDDKFCNVCGQVVPQAAPQPMNPGGQPNNFNQPPMNPGGQPNNFGQPPVNQQPPMMNNFNQGMQPNYNGQPNNFGQPPMNQNFGQPPKKDNTLIIVIAVVLLLAIVGIILYFTLGRSNNEPSTPSNPNQGGQNTPSEQSTSDKIAVSGYQFSLPSGYEQYASNGYIGATNSSKKAAILVFQVTNYPISDFVGSAEDIKQSLLAEEGVKITNSSTKTISGKELLIFSGTITSNGQTIDFAEVFGPVDATHTAQLVIYKYGNITLDNILSDAAYMISSAKQSGYSSITEEKDKDDYGEVANGDILNGLINE